MEKKIIRVNKIKCRKCGDIIESTSVHDFIFCSCGACAVDGGMEYLKRVGEYEDWEELSILCRKKEFPVDSPLRGSSIM